MTKKIVLTLLMGLPLTSYGVGAKFIKSRVEHHYGRQPAPAAPVQQVAEQAPQAPENQNSGNPLQNVQQTQEQEGDSALEGKTPLFENRRQQSSLKSESKKSDQDAQSDG